MTQSLLWLASLARATGGRVEEGRLRIYAEALDQEAAMMTREALLAAALRFDRFPSVKELAEFIAGRRKVKLNNRTIPAQDPPNIRQAAAIALVRTWVPPPGVSGLTGGEWYREAYVTARDMVERGEVRYRMDRSEGYARIVIE